MCGLAGFVERGGLNANAGERLRTMTDALSHRGPDDAGYWCDEAAGIALGHRRLSIVDLSPAGHQPMHSACGRFTIVFNGEIYNHNEIRRELEEAGLYSSWRGHSDTEVLLAAFACWGVQKTLARSVGMFAFALWDAKEKALTLARDRMGEKPLYYGWQGKAFLFASEVGAFQTFPDWRGEIDKGALALLMRYNAVPAPHSVYVGIKKLLGGHLLILHEGQEEPKIVCYWDLTQVASQGFSEPFTGGAQEASDELDRLLRQSLAGQMVADVPLGCFLSGGVDSSTIVAVMQSMRSQPVRTFSIGFEEEGYNEAGYANKVARHLGTQHTEMIVSAKQARDVVPLLPTLYSEPFSDSSQIPTFLVSKLAREHVTVSLSGDGGDELFSGYARYALAGGLWKKLSLLPQGLRGVAARAICALSPKRWDQALALPSSLLPARYRHKNAGDKLHKLASILSLPDEETFYRSLTSHWKTPSALVLGGEESPTLLTGLRDLPKTPTFVQKMMLMDQLTYLPDDILTKVDRASMAVGLESRVPLLDHRLVSFAWSLPLGLLCHEGLSKGPLRQILYRHVPRELIERPKIGFGVPLDSWLRGPLRDWAESLLESKRLKEEGLFDTEMVCSVWQEHLSGNSNQAYLLWDVLMFQAWNGSRGG
ncbi:MAG TPA: asparagine synthase (glutamine-hydrolyzing) [Rhodospirillaceae bacterium]|nr:asparagine synthase (glutamine-hydrolyzing) [Rhodospirillaceae bacterium]